MGRSEGDSMPTLMRNNYISDDATQMAKKTRVKIGTMAGKWKLPTWEEDKEMDREIEAEFETSLESSL